MIGQRTGGARGRTALLRIDYLVLRSFTGTCLAGRLARSKHFYEDKGIVPKVFVSYRRDDSEASTGRLYDRLSSHLGANRLFRDIDSLRPGIDYVDAIAKAVSSCDALVAVIGRQWSTLLGAGGERRLDDPEDFVCREIELALQKGIPVFPVLVDGASMPARKDLPVRLAKLADYQALALDHDHWGHDIERLLAALSDLDSPARPLEEKRAGPWRVPSWLVSALLIAGLTLGLWLAYSLWKTDEEPPPPPRPPVLGIIPFKNDSGGQEVDRLTEAVTGKLDLSADLYLAGPRKMAAVLSAARTGDDLSRVAAAVGIDYLLTGEVAPGGLSLNARVAATGDSRRVKSTTLYGLAEERLPDNTQRITELTRKGMGLPARERVDLWAADFPTSKPAAYLSYVDGLQALSGERYEEAKGHFSAALREDPRYVMARYRLAWAFAFAGQTDQALSHIRSAIAAAQALPDRERQYLRAAELYFARRYEEASTAYRNLIAKHPLEIEARRHLANILMEPGSYEEAVRLWQYIEQWEPLEASKNLGFAYLELGRYGKAVQQLEPTAKDWPKDARVHGLLGNAYQATGDFQRAAREYEAALAIEPHLYNIVIQLAVLDLLRGGPDEAVQRLTPIVSDDRVSATDRIDAGFELAYLLRAGGRFGEAGRLLRNLGEDITAEQVREALALSVRAMCAMESRDLRSARALVQRALRSAPEGRPRTRYLFTRGLLELRAGSMDGVRRTAAEIRLEARKFPSARAEANRTADKAAAYLLGMALLAEGKPNYAIRSLSDSVTLPGREYRIYRLGLANAYLAAGRLGDALAAAAEVTRRRQLDDPRLELELDRNLALLLMAQVERRMGRRESAAAHAERFLGAWKHADRTLPQVEEALQLVLPAASERRKLSPGVS